MPLFRLLSIACTIVCTLCCAPCLSSNERGDSSGESSLIPVSAAGVMWSRLSMHRAGVQLWTRTILAPRPSLSTLQVDDDEAACVHQSQLEGRRAHGGGRGRAH